MTGMISVAADRWRRSFLRPDAPLSGGQESRRHTGPACRCSRPPPKRREGAGPGLHAAPAIRPPPLRGRGGRPAKPPPRRRPTRRSNARRSRAVRWPRRARAHPPHGGCVRARPAHGAQPTGVCARGAGRAGRRSARRPGCHGFCPRRPRGTGAVNGAVAALQRRAVAALQRRGRRLPRRGRRWQRRGRRLAPAARVARAGTGAGVGAGAPRGAGGRL